MRNPTVDDVVRLNKDLPYLNLRKGDTGVVRSLWFAPREAYEVEFHRSAVASDALGLDEKTRAVLMREQVDLTELLEGGDASVLPGAAERFDDSNVCGCW